MRNAAMQGAQSSVAAVRDYADAYMQQMFQDSTPKKPAGKVAKSRHSGLGKARDAPPKAQRTLDFDKAKQQLANMQNDARKRKAPQRRTAAPRPLRNQRSAPSRLRGGVRPRWKARYTRRRRSAVGTW